MRNILLLLLLPILAFSQNPDFDVRSLRWGMTKAQVIDIEGETYENTREGNGLIFNNILAGQDTLTLLYWFNSGNQLARAYISIKSGISCVVAYNVIEARLEEKNGRPVSRKEYWEKRGRRPKNVEDWCDPVKKGELMIITEWVTPLTKITHHLSEIRGKPSHSVSYTSTEVRQPSEKGSRDY